MNLLAIHNNYYEIAFFIYVHNCVKKLKYKIKFKIFLKLTLNLGYSIILIELTIFEEI